MKTTVNPSSLSHPFAVFKFKILTSRADDGVDPSFFSTNLMTSPSNL